MRSVPFLLATALLSQACYVGPVFRVKPKKQACPEPFLIWGGGLVAHVDAGSGDGTFAYAPADPLLEWVEGRMDLKTGDFAYYNDYVGDSYRATDAVEGYGTLWRDGDIDIAYSVEAVTDEKDVLRYDVREQRLGCEQERWVMLTGLLDEDADEDEPVPSEVWSGEYTGGVFEYEHRFGVRGQVVTAEGVTEPNGSYSEEADYDEDGVEIHWEEEGDGAGNVRREFYEKEFGELDGYWERDKNGDLTVEYLYSPAGSQVQVWDYEVSEKGNGGGSLEVGNNRCDIDLDEWECTLEDCDNDILEGSPCFPPVEVPLVEYRRG